MTQYGSLDITSRPTLQAVIPVPERTQRAIEARGITPAPDRVVLLLCEPTNREKYAFHTEIAGMTDLKETVEWTAKLLKTRCKHETPLEVLEEVLWDGGESILGVLQEAYMSGRLTDPKQMGGAIKTMQAKMTDAALNAIQTEFSASSPTTELDRGNAESLPNPS